MQDKVALVSGASRGIGKAIALELAQAGFFVIGTATTETGSASISDYLAAAGLEGKGFSADVSNEESVAALFASILADHDAPLVIVNNAGITADNLLMRMKGDEWSSVIDTNLGSMYRVCKVGVKAMTKARWGRIINISSVVGASGNAGQTNYAASKAGMIGFNKSLAAEVASRGITVNIVAPGFIETPMTDVLDEGQKTALLTRVPAGRLGTPAEIAASVVFLASDEAAYVTGMTMHVNGGMAML